MATKERAMKKILATTALIFAASSAYAETRYATVTSVTPNYQTVYRNVPKTQCSDVEVPIYGNSSGGATGGDVLTGMIIGGLIGKGITGQDNGAAAGAVMGGVIAADKGNKKVVTGYRVERQCSEVMVRVEEKEIKNYLITYNWNGIKGSSYTYNYYAVGNKLPVSVSIVAQ